MSASPPRPGSPDPPETALDVWEHREERLLDVLPYGGLAIGTLLTLVFPDAARAGLGWMLALVAAAVVWLTLLRTPANRPARQPAGAVFYAGLAALMAALVLVSPLFGFFAFAGYGFIDALPDRWKVLGVAATAAVAGTAQIGGFPLADGVPVAGWIGLMLANFLIAGTIMFFSVLTYARREQRREALRELAETNRRLEATLAENAALQAQLVEQARDAGVVEERQRMAREIHDTLAQGLTGIVAQIQAAEQAERRPSDWRRHLRTAAQLARESLAEARRSVQAVRPEALENARLPEAVAEVARRWSSIQGVGVEVTTTGRPRPLPTEVEVTLLRTAQEALANVAKHACAGRVGVTLSYMEDAVTLDVRDDGVGFAVGPAAGDGVGLVAMRQRVEGLGGRLEIESEPGGGTAISASAPTVDVVDVEPVVTAARADEAAAALVGGRPAAADAPRPRRSIGGPAR